MREPRPTPQQRLADDHRQRTGLLRAWLVVLLAGWLFVWLLVVIEAVEYMDYVEEWEPALSKGQLLPFAIILMALATFALVPLVSSRVDSWAQVPASVERARFGASAAIAAQLSRLSALHASGHLTDQEFDLAKQKLLASDTSQALPEPQEVGRAMPKPQGSDQATAEYDVSVARHDTGTPIVRSNQSNILGTLSLVSGIASLLLCVVLRYLIGVPSLVAGMTAVTLGGLSLRRFQQGRASNRGQAIAGLVCGALGTVISTVLLGIYLFAVD